MSLSFTLLFHLHHETEAERPSARAYDEVLGLARQADTLPIERIWFAEHHLLDTRGRLPAPLLMCVAVARETRQIGVGPCVLLLPLHHPLDLAEQVVTADVLCHGRLAVGVGSGGNPEEIAAFGVPMSERRGRFAEGLAVFARLLTGEPTSANGAYYAMPEVALVPPPLQRADEILWVAASSLGSATLAGQSGGHLLLARGVSTPDLLDQIEAYRQARGDAGYDVASARIQVTRGLYVAEDEATAWREAEQGIRRHYARLARFGGEEAPLREMARRGDFIVGTPDQCAEQILALAREAPITHLACDVALIGAPVEHVSRSLNLLGRDVIPRLNASAARPD